MNHPHNQPDPHLSRRDRARDLRDWANFWVTIGILPMIAFVVWVGKTWMDKHDLQLAAAIRDTYVTKTELASETENRLARDTSLQNQITRTNEKLDVIALGQGKIEQKLDDLKDQLARSKNKSIPGYP